MPKFRATIHAEGSATRTGIEVPASVVDALGSGKRPKVRVTLRDYTYRRSVASMGGRYLIPVSADVRSRTGVAAGDEIDINLELDDQPRRVEVPADLTAALAAEPAATRAFEQLSYSERRRIVDGITRAKRPETRARRIDQAIMRLRGGDAEARR